jgi:hypothetical protein
MIEPLACSKNGTPRAFDPSHEQRHSTQHQEETKCFVFEREFSRLRVDLKLDRRLRMMKAQFSVKNSSVLIVSFQQVLNSEIAS